jgi:hypothetical protein
MEPEVSCQSLKKAGILKDSIYTLKGSNDKYPRLSHCAMTTSQNYNDVNMETLIGYVDPRSLPGGVMFAVLNSGNGIIVNVDLTFNHVVSNVGNSMNPTTGIFKAPVLGTYQFSFSAVTGSEGGMSYVYVFKNGEEAMAIVEESKVVGRNNFGQNWQMNLKTGDEIKLTLYGTIFEDSVVHTVFIGQLVAE